MTEKTAIKVKKLHQLLIENTYLSVADISDKLRIKPWSVYRLIRYLRIEGIGILPSTKGYVLSESAQKKDDVHFIRRCFGRRTSDLLALQTAHKDIEKRWNAVEDKNNIGQVMKYLSINPTNTNKATEGIQYLLLSINE